MDIGAAVISGDHHVCVTDDSGGLWHAIRSFFNSLWTSFGDVKGQAGNPGFLTRVSCAAVQGELHVAALDQSGDLWHCIRHANGTWTPMGSVKAAIGSNPGVFDDVAIAEVAGELHLAACGARVWHTIRHPDGSWTAFGDVKGQSGDPGMVTMLDASSVNGEFHLVVGTSTGQVFHTIRHSNGWTQFGDVFGQAGQKSRAVEVACAGYGGELQLAIEQNTFVRHGK
jgi:hypothetical protein